MSCGSNSTSTIGHATMIVVMRATQRAAESLDDVRVAASPIERLAVRGALHRIIMDMARAGELDEERLSEGALAVVLGSDQSHRPQSVHARSDRTSAHRLAKA